MRLFLRLFCGFVVPGAPEGSTGRRFLEKPGIVPARALSQVIYCSQFVGFQYRSTI